MVKDSLVTVYSLPLCETLTPLLDEELNDKFGSVRDVPDLLSLVWQSK